MIESSGAGLVFDGAGRSCRSGRPALALVVGFALVVLALPGVAWAGTLTPTEIGSASALPFTFTPTPPLSLTTTQAVPAGGSVIVVAHDQAEASPAPTGASCSDSNGDTYRTDVSFSDGISFLTVVCSTSAISSALGPGATITVTWTGGNGAEGQLVQAFSVTGLEASPVDQTAMRDGPGSSPSSGQTATTGQADELLFGTVVDQVNNLSGAGFNAGSNGTANDCVSTETPDYSSLGGIDVSGEPYSSASTSLFPMYCVVQAPAAYAAQASLSSGFHVWDAVIATYKWAVTSSSASLGASPNPSVFGQAVTLTATVTGSDPTGTVAFKDGAATIPGCGAQPLAAASAICTTSGLSVGNHTITATYSGDQTDTASSSPPLTQIVNKANTTTTITGSPNPSVFGHAVTFTATVTGSDPTGTVAFKDGAMPIAGCGAQPLAAGSATCTTSGLSVGNHRITAVYGGDADNEAISSPPLAQAVAARIPRLARLRVLPDVFEAATSGPTIARASHTGTTISYRDTLAARTQFRVLRCAGKRGRCTRLVLVGSFTHRDHKGSNRFHFTGRVKGRALAPGRYVLKAIATLAGQKSRATSAPFQILAPCSDPDHDGDRDAAGQI